MMAKVRLQQEPFSPGTELDAFTAAAQGVGAIVSFTGIMRSTVEDPVIELVIEHYAELAAAAIEEFVAAATQRFAVTELRVIHRFGRILPNEPIMLVISSARHRADAFAAAEYLMDWLKTDAPFWKNETRPHGGMNWVEPREADNAARSRWNE